MPIFWCWFSVFAPIFMIISEFILATESVLKFKHWYHSRNPQHGERRWSDVGNLTENEINSLPGGHNGRLTKMLDQEEAYKTKKYCCLCPIIEYFEISVPFCYYSLLGWVIDFPSRVRVVKKIPSTGRVASTRHSLQTRPDYLSLYIQRHSGLYIQKH